MATDAVGTDGGGPWRIAGAMAAGDLLRGRRGPRYDGGMRSCLRVARYTWSDVKLDEEGERHAVHLSDGSSSYGCRVEFLEHVMEGSLEDPLYDVFGVL